MLGLGAALALIAPAGSAAAEPAPQPAFKVLVFSKTGGYRHDSIPIAVQGIEDLGTANGFTVDATEDDTVFTPANLADYQAVVFALTTGDVLNDTEKAAFGGYIRAGGGYAGIHSGTEGRPPGRRSRSAFQVGVPAREGGEVGVAFGTRRGESSGGVHAEEVEEDGLWERAECVMVKG
ncbi:ThuA domain-containing protein [Kitasatospora sp. NPDC004669]|uniref:ThuA domain-containing protein n=1 Tax=Kitasatospora sp. NPDC004669 TaxID=3154555 RepID=UPI0033AC15B0